MPTAPSRMRPDEHLSTPWRVLTETDVARVTRWAQARNDALPERAAGLVLFETDVLDAAPKVDELLAEVDADPTCISWG